MHIEPVDERNVAHCVQLGQELVKLGSFGQNGPRFDWDYALQSTLASLRSPDYYIRVGVDDRGDYCGFVGGHVTPFFFSPTLMGVEDGWYVRDGTPGRTKIAVALMRGFVAWCLDERRAILVQTGDVAAINSLAVDAIYKHMGFTRFGTIYKYERRT